MRIAIRSDIHDNVGRRDQALEATQHVDALLCRGDLCSPFAVHQLGRAFRNPIYIFGNNHAGLYGIATNARQHDNIRLHGELFRGEFDGARFAMNHYDSIARGPAASGEFDVVCHGHNHVFSIERIRDAPVINAGAIMGAAFAPDGASTGVASTFAIYETLTGEAAPSEV